MRGDEVAQGTVDLNTDQRLSSSMVTLFALACGLSAANLYYAQPVLSSISKSFHTNSSGVGLVVTFAQIGYALGLAFVVPLGDVLARRRLVPGVLLLTCASLIVCAFAPSASVLIAVSLFVGLGSVAAQILVPMAASLSAPSERGRVVGTVMSGLLLGILLARTISGVIAELSSWRTVYIVAAVMALVLAVVLSKRLPAEQTRPHVRYITLLADTVRYFTSEKLLRQRALLGGLSFGAFSVLWTTLGVPAERRAVPLQRPHDRTLRSRRRRRSAVRQLCRTLGRSPLDEVHHLGLRRNDRRLLLAALVGTALDRDGDRGHPRP